MANRQEGSLMKQSTFEAFAAEARARGFD